MSPISRQTRLDWPCPQADGGERQLVAGTAFSPNSPTAVIGQRAYDDEDQLPGTAMKWYSRPKPDTAAC